MRDYSTEMRTTADN